MGLVTVLTGFFRRRCAFRRRLLGPVALLLVHGQMPLRGGGSLAGRIRITKNAPGGRRNTGGIPA